MQKYISFFLIFLVTVISGCKKIDETIYFRHVEIEGKQTIEGRYPISEGLAGRADCYYFTYDSLGKLIEVGHLNDGKLAGEFDNLGLSVAKIKIEYSKEFEDWIYFDENGKKAGVFNIYSVRYKLNKNGNPISKFNYNQNGKLTKDFYDVAHYSWERSKFGRKVREIYFDEEGKRIHRFGLLLKTDSLYENTYRYNLLLKTVKIQNLDKSNRFITDKFGVSSILFKNDKHGNKIMRSNFSRTGELIGSKFNIAITRWKYDRNGYMIEEKFLDSDKKLVKGSDGVAITRWEYDKYGNKLEQSFYNPEGKPIIHYWGASTIKHKYDEHNRIVESRYYGTDGRLCKDNYGVAIYRYSYTLNDSIYEECLHLNENEELIEDKDGIAIRQFVKKGNHRRQIKLDKNRNKIQ